MTAYCLWNMKQIYDEDGMNEYRAGVHATVAAFGGEYVVIGGPWQVVEGDWHPTFPVMITFPTIEAANQWYESEAYRPLRELRLRSSDCDAVFFDSSGVAEHFARADERRELAAQSAT